MGMVRTGSSYNFGGSRSCVISHSEIILSLQQFESHSVIGEEAIEPSSSSLFPWLRGIARNFEKYHFRSLAFEYCPMVATTMPGVVVLAIDWDPDDTHTTSSDENAIRASMECRPECVRCPVWQGAILKVPDGILRSLGERWVRAPLNDQTEQRLVAVGKLLHCVTPTGTSYGDYSMVGEVRIHYTIELISPQLLSPEELDPPTDIYTGVVDMTSTRAGVFNLKELPCLDYIDPENGSVSATIQNEWWNSNPPPIKVALHPMSGNVSNLVYEVVEDFNGTMLVNAPTEEVLMSGLDPDLAPNPGTYSLIEVDPTNLNHLIARTDYEIDRSYSDGLIKFCNETTTDASGRKVTTTVQRKTFDQVISVAGKFIKGQLFRLVSDTTNWWINGEGQILTFFAGQFLKDLLFSALVAGGSSLSALSSHPMTKRRDGRVVVDTISRSNSTKKPDPLQGQTAFSSLKVKSWSPTKTDVHASS